MVKNINTQEFKENIFDYTKHSDWKFQGKKPTIIDFYADWCGPCKMLQPILEELSEEYKDKVNFVKVNTENEVELAKVFGIMSIPTMLFIPLNDQPVMQPGLLPKEVLKQVINERLLNENEAAA